MYAFVFCLKIRPAAAQKATSWRFSAFVFSSRIFQRYDTRSRLMIIMYGYIGRNEVVLCYGKGSRIGNNRMFPNQIENPGND